MLARKEKKTGTVGGKEKMQKRPVVTKVTPSCLLPSPVPMPQRRNRRTSVLLTPQKGQSNTHPFSAFLDMQSFNVCYSRSMTSCVVCWYTRVYGLPVSFVFRKESVCVCELLMCEWQIWGVHRVCLSYMSIKVLPRIRLTWMEKCYQIRRGVTTLGEVAAFQ